MELKLRTNVLVSFVRKWVSANPGLNFEPAIGFPLFFLNKNIVFRTEAGYSYFLADFRLKIFLRILLVSGISVTRNFGYKNDCGIA